MHLDRPSPTLDLLVGAVAGGVATVILGGVTSVLYERENRLARWREDLARGGESSYEIAADRIAGIAGVHLNKGRRSAVGTAVNYGIGSGSGAVYGVVRRLIPAPAPIRGLGFGLALWLVADEGLNPALGLTPGPRAFPWQTHARGLAGHLVFGVVAEGLLAASDLLRGASNP